MICKFSKIKCLYRDVTDIEGWLYRGLTVFILIVKYVKIIAISKKNIIFIKKCEIVFFIINMIY